MINIAIFASGQGSNFEAIFRYFEMKNILRIVCLVCDNPKAKALTLAKDFGIETYLIAPSSYKTKLEPELENKLVNFLIEKKTDLIVLAGYMRIIKTPLLKAFSGRIINLHPSLLPSFPGLNAVRQALSHGVKVTGCTVHYIDEYIDHGEIIAQKAVAIEESDTEETLLNKIHAEEHSLYPAVIEQIAQNWNLKTERGER